MGRHGGAMALVLAAGLLQLLPGLAWAEALRREDAEVVAREGGALLYRESHWVDPVAGRRLVLYRCADGRAFARKWVRTAALPWAPDYRFEDARGGYRERVDGGGAQREVEIGSAAAVAVTVPADGVIDAGFDAAVRDHWADLAAGRNVRLQFLLPTRARFVPVRVQRLQFLSWRGLPAWRLRMQVDAWFGFALPAVELVYAQADRRLLEFDGTGNVRDADGRNPQVRIVFATSPQAATAADMASAGQLPLSACAAGPL